MRPKLLSRLEMEMAVLAFALATFVTGSAFAAASLAAQTSREGAVTVKVTPLELSAGSAAWRFAVVFDTHVAPLNDDVLAVATLTGAGKQVRPAHWEGDKPGSHHRKGVLQFDAIKPAPSSVTLAIRGVGGVAERRFEWKVPVQ